MEVIGSIVLHLHSGFKLHLNNVLFVPSLKRNLISVQLLDIDGFGCNFGYMKCLSTMMRMLVLHICKTSFICFSFMNLC
jgi:hypothetical protein